MKKIDISIAVPLLVFIVLASACSSRRDQASRGSARMKLVVAVTPLSHPSLEQSYKGFIQGLKEKGYDEAKVRIESLNANGDFSRIPSLVKHALEMKPDAIFVVTTPAASATIKITDPARVPLLYTAVTDPVAAKIVTTMDGSETLATGVSDRYPVEEQVRVFSMLQPAMESAGLIFNPAEENSQILVRQTLAALEKIGVKGRKYEVQTAGDLPSQVKQALQANDSIIVNGDNLVTENLATVINLCVTQKKPLFVGDPDSVRKGAIATVGPSYFDIGRQTGNKAAEILGGKSARDIPSEFPNTFDYIINTEAARLMGLDIPDTFWQAREIWESRTTTSE